MCKTYIGTETASFKSWLSVFKGSADARPRKIECNRAIAGFTNCFPPPTFKPLAFIQSGVLSSKKIYPDSRATQSPH